MKACSLSAVLLLGIGMFVAPHPALGQGGPAVTPTKVLLGEFGLLETRVRQARRPNCWTLVLRGTLRNPYDEPVAGVRLIVRLRSAGETPRELERMEAEVSTTINPGESVPFDREMNTFCTMTFHNVSVVAFAHRRGAVDLPAPDLEVEAKASAIQEVASSPGNVPSINAPVASDAFGGY